MISAPFSVALARLTHSILSANRSRESESVAEERERERERRSVGESAKATTDRHMIRRVSRVSSFSRADATVIRRTRHAAPAKGPERPCIVSEERDRSERSPPLRLRPFPPAPRFRRNGWPTGRPERTRSREEESCGRPGEVVKKRASRTKCEVSTSISLREHFLLRVGSWS